MNSKQIAKALKTVKPLTDRMNYEAVNKTDCKSYIVRFYEILVRGGSLYIGGQDGKTITIPNVTGEFCGFITADNFKIFELYDGEITLHAGDVGLIGMCGRDSFTLKAIDAKTYAKQWLKHTWTTAFRWRGEVYSARWNQQAREMTVYRLA